MSAEREWEPGDPLYTRNASYQGYFYNFRDVELTDECLCPDRASWPEPAFWGQDLGRQPDEVERFITEYRAWEARNG